MTRILISNRAQRDFAMVPNGVWRADLPFAAKGVACYLFSLRDGSMPYVAEMETALGLGRDARRKAFAVLESLGFIEWQVVRNSRGSIVSKTLVLDSDVFTRAPEIQADGGIHHTPENPAGGFPVPAKVETRPCNDGISGDTIRQNKTKGAVARVAAARSVKRAAPLPASGQAAPVPLGGGSGAGGLSAFQRSRVLSGQSVLVDGATLHPATPAFARLVELLRNSSAGGNGGLQ